MRRQRQHERPVIDVGGDQPGRQRRQLGVARAEQAAGAQPANSPTARGWAVIACTAAKATAAVTAGASNSAIRARTAIVPSRSEANMRSTPAATIGIASHMA